MLRNPTKPAIPSEVARPSVQYGASLLEGLLAG
jgi:hypothetical protein